MADAPAALCLTRAQADMMLAHIWACLPEEACGILTGHSGEITAVRPVTNALHSPVRFRMDAQELVDTILWAEQQGWDLTAIFHSHPTGPGTPSQTDVAEWYYPESLAVIWAPDSASTWRMRAFKILEGAAAEVVVNWQTGADPNG